MLVVVDTSLLPLKEQAPALHSTTMELGNNDIDLL